MKTRSLIFLLFLIICGTATAQNYSGDARKIGIGGLGYSENPALRLVEEENRYTAIVIPFGLIQLIQDFDKFDPDNEDIFDPILAVEYAANPLHYGFDRVSGEARGRFVSDVFNGELSRDLNDYRGFNLTDHYKGGGLVSPNWGKTFKVIQKDSGSFHGFYVGVGPYISAKTELFVDEELTDVLSSPTEVPIPNRNFDIYNQSSGQLALAVTGGYRARFSLANHNRSGLSNRNGIYVSMNYHYLFGFRYEDMDLAVQFDTDSEGLLTMDPATSPIDLYYLNSRSGRGFALDFGAAVVYNGWEFGFGANGVANRIDWKDLILKKFFMESILEGGDFVEEWIPLSNTNLRAELPTQYSGSASYTRKALTVGAEISRGYQDLALHAGAEYRLRIIEFRGGMRYGMDRYHPNAGLGINLGSLVSLDVAAYWSTTNIERELRPGVAASLRINHRNSNRNPEFNH